MTVHCSRHTTHQLCILHVTLQKPIVPYRELVLHVKLQVAKAIFIQMCSCIRFIHNIVVSTYTRMDLWPFIYSCVYTEPSRLRSLVLPSSNVNLEQQIVDRRSWYPSPQLDGRISCRLHAFMVTAFTHRRRARPPCRTPAYTIAFTWTLCPCCHAAILLCLWVRSVI
jgi:hypothetical protein